MYQLQEDTPLLCFEFVLALIDCIIKRIKVPTLPSEGTGKKRKGKSTSDL